jgi:AcrR family transcriptional regulator
LTDRSVDNKIKLEPVQVSRHRRRISGTQMARGRAQGYDEQRQAILERAAQLFARHGYSATSMNQVAEACGLSKATLYHYYRDKYSLLVSIADEHVSRLQALVEGFPSSGLPPQAHLEQLIHRIVAEYANAQHAHRVLTEDVKFLRPEDQARVLGKERQVVAGFARAVSDLRPELEAAGLSKPLTMLLFGMINWLFTWMKPDGALTHETMAPIVSDLFFGGIPAVRIAKRPASACR